MCSPPGDWTEIVSGPDEADCGGTDESCTVAINGNEPTVVGVPEIWPVVLFKANPGGRLFGVTLHVYGVAPPVAVSDMLYGWLTVAGGREAVVTESGVAGLIITVKSVDVTENGGGWPITGIPPRSVAFTKNGYVPEVVGTPSKVPF